MANRRINPSQNYRKTLPPECEAPGCSRKPKSRVGDTALCSMHYRRMKLYGSFDLPAKQPQPWAACSIDGCDSPARTRSGALCEVHYYRSYRTGSFDDPDYKRRYLSTGGYVLLSGAQAHPVAPRGGVVYEHRKVLYDAIGYGVHNCHWCGVEVEWFAKGKRKLVVDHLDGNKQHNAVSNLVPSCHRCNSTRGLFQHWVMTHKDDPFLWALYEKAQDAA